MQPLYSAMHDDTTLQGGGAPTAYTDKASLHEVETADHASFTGDIIHAQTHMLSFHIYSSDF
jgi:hypothetical protein